MNERIKELAEQAGFPDWWIKPLEPERQNGESEKMIEKFAELIAADCVNMIEAAAENADEEDVHGMRNAAGLISRAFITFYDADLKNNGTF